jgi:hypothetical protein
MFNYTKNPGDFEELSKLPPRKFRLESELPVPDLPEPVRIDPDSTQCQQESIDDEEWECKNPAVWQIGFAFVCGDCFEAFWKTA